MDQAAQKKLEEDVRAACGRGEFDAAATRTIKGYGPEIFGFLAALHRSDADASDVFSLFSEKLWKGLPAFGWQSSLRTWAYTIARNTSFRFRKQGKRHAGAPLDDSSMVGKLVQEVRTATLTFLKTEQKDRFSALRESLDEEDQTLLILRVDRGLAWEELARVMLEEADTAPTTDDLKRESARLRKRFQLVKEKLLEMGKRAGLVTPKDGG